MPFGSRLITAYMVKPTDNRKVIEKLQNIIYNLPVD